MPNDAKLGLVVGVSLVIAVAVVFFRKEIPDPARNPVVRGDQSVGGPAAPVRQRPAHGPGAFCHPHGQHRGGGVIPGLRAGLQEEFSENSARPLARLKNAT